MRKSIIYLKDYLVLTLIAILSALVLALFRYLSTYIFWFSSLQLAFTWQNFIVMFTLDLSLIAINGFLIHKVNRTGISIFVIEKRIHDKEWIRVGANIFLTFITCYISFALGLSLGAENPMVILGGLIGYFMYRSFNMHKRRGFLIGAAIGFSIALVNPFIGITMYLEKYDCHASIKNIFKVIYSTVLSYLIYCAIFQNFHYVILFETINEYLSSSQYTILIIIPVIVILSGLLFSKTIAFVRIFFHKHLPEYVEFSIVLVVLLVLKFCYPQALGTGDTFFKYIEINTTVLSLIIYLIIRFIFIVFSYNVNFNGGMVIPTLAFGAGIGELIVLVSKSFFAFDQEQEMLIMVITMLSFYAFVSKGYFTALAMSFSFISFQYIVPPLLIVLVITYLINAHTEKFDGISPILLKMDSNNTYKVMKIFKVFDKPHYTEQEMLDLKRQKRER